MRDFYEVIKRPVVTEKGSLIRASGNKAIFEVALTANKHEIRSAVENLFSVTVVDVKTIRMRGKRRRVGRVVGRTSDWKKAIVTLHEGDRIEVFEGL